MGHDTGVNKDFEYNAMRAVINYCKTIGNMRTLLGKESNELAIKSSGELARDAINYIKEGHVRYVQEAIHCIRSKVGLDIDYKYGDAGKHTECFEATVKALRDYNNGNEKIENISDIFAISTSYKEGDTVFKTNNLTFVEANAKFNMLLKGIEYENIKLIENDMLIRGFDRSEGEYRNIRYEALNGFEDSSLHEMKITYDDIKVQLAYTYHQDPGHGWLEVPVQELKDLGIAQRITAYSYMKGDKAFLEEDLDAGTFLDMREKVNKHIELKNEFTNDRSFIRNFPSYNNSAVFKLLADNDGLHKPNLRQTKKAHLDNGMER